jgi:hypothetical protein
MLAPNTFNGTVVGVLTTQCSTHGRNCTAGCTKVLETSTAETAAADCSCGVDCAVKAVAMTPPVTPTNQHLMYTLPSSHAL